MIGRSPPPSRPISPIASTSKSFQPNTSSQHSVNVDVINDNLSDDISATHHDVNSSHITLSREKNNEWQIVKNTKRSRPREYSNTSDSSTTLPKKRQNLFTFLTTDEDEEVNNINDVQMQERKEHIQRNVKNVNQTYPPTVSQKFSIEN